MRLTASARRFGRSREKAAKAGELLFRYLVARYRCVGGSLSAGRIRLAAEISDGIQVFEGAIVIDPDAEPPIVNDREHQAFFVGIINGDDAAIPAIEPTELANWRQYVLSGGPVPRWRQPAAIGGAPTSKQTASDKSSILDRLPLALHWLRRLLRSLLAEKESKLLAVAGPIDSDQSH